MKKWELKDEWHRHGKDCLVVVRHHTVIPFAAFLSDGVHRWCIYAYIYPKHQKFADFDGKNIYQPATQNMPLHGGCSFLRWHIDSETKEPTSVQVGADYNHYGDDEFLHYATPEDAYEVFSDADALFDFLNNG